MADPKYANLPGIDTESPDVYETSDVVEREQCLVEEDVSETIDSIKISASDARNEFKDKTLESSKTDFSDRIKARRHVGYGIPQIEYEMSPYNNPNESLTEKFQRLQNEIVELEMQAKEIASKAKADLDSEKPSAVLTLEQLEFLKRQIKEVNLQEILSGDGVNLGDPQNVLTKRLLTEIENIKLTPSVASKATTDASAKSDVVYQMHMLPKMDKVEASNELAAVEKRLQSLEAVVGKCPEKLGQLTADYNGKSLLEISSLLAAKTKLLEPGQLDQIEGRLQALVHRLNTLSEKKQQAEANEQLTKVNELYELVKKWDLLNDSIPGVVDRLNSLKELHQQALEFSQALKQLETSQQLVTINLQGHDKMFQQVQETITKNMDAVKANYDNISDRLEKLKK